MFSRLRGISISPVQTENAKEIMSRLTLAVAALAFLLGAPLAACGSEDFPIAALQAHVGESRRSSREEKCLEGA